MISSYRKENIEDMIQSVISLRYISHKQELSVLERIEP